MKTLLPWLACFCAVACEPNRPADNRQDFSVQAEVLEALEGGPLVVRVTLLYHGKQEKDIYQRIYQSNAWLTMPGGRRFRSKADAIISGPWGRSLVLKPEGKLTETLRLPREDANIASGEKTITVVWDVFDDPERPPLPGEEGDPVAAPSVKLKIDVRAATPENLAALRKRMEDRLSLPGLSDDDKRDLVHDIVSTRHRPLAPLAWKLIEAPKAPYSKYDLIDFVYDCSDAPADVDARLAKLAVDPDWDDKWAVFGEWDRRHIDPAPAAWQTLIDSDNVWTKVWTYTSFPKRCPREWKEVLLKGLADVQKPIPDAQFDRLLHDLDDDAFDVRERASTRLVSFGERVAPQLRQALRRPLSGEAKQRVKGILAKLEKAKESPDCVNAVDYLRLSPSPESKELLSVLADGPPDAWLTKEAKAALAERAKRAAPPDK
jgi:hypothetical protein